MWSVNYSWVSRIILHNLQKKAVAVRVCNEGHLVSDVESHTLSEPPRRSLIYLKRVISFNPLRIGFQDQEIEDFFGKKYK